LKNVMLTLLGTTVLFFVLFQPSLVWSKPKPVEGIYKMFDAFNKLETELRDDRWDDSINTINYIQNYYGNLSKILKVTVNEKIVNKFGFHISSLKSKVRGRNLEGIETDYMEMQRLFIDIMDHYEYQVPPAIIILGRYLDEAKEGLEEKEFSETVEEMKEIAGLRSKVERAFSELGLSADTIDNFFNTVTKVEKAANEKNEIEARTGLQELENILYPFIQGTK